MLFWACRGCRGLARREAVGESWRSEPYDECVRGQSDVKTTFVSTAHVKGDICKGSDWFMVHITAVKAHVQYGMSTKNDKDKFNNEWQAVIEEYEDGFPEEHPGMPPRRYVELANELREIACIQVVSG
jgi:hypothetical protein